jgi:hypothetical protein
MASLETLPPDQRAVLELVLRRGHSYDEIARLLSIDRAAVRARALAGFDALGPQTGVPPERRALITDYLLDQLPARVSEDVRERIAQSAAERAWARVLASELAPLTARPLPEIPVEARRREPAEREDDRRESAERAEGRQEAAAPARGRRRERSDRRRERAAAPVAAGGSEPSATKASAARRAVRPSSRRGGALLLGLTTLVVAAVIVVLIVSGGGSKHKAAARTSSTAASTSKTGTSGTRIVAQINLVPPSGSSKAAGIAEVLKQGGGTGIAIIAQGVAPNSKNPPDAYAVWLYNTPNDSHILGFVNPGVGTNGRLQTAGALPSNAAHYRQLLVTLETRSNPTVPGKIVLQGALTGVS